MPILRLISSLYIYYSNHNIIQYNTIRIIERAYIASETEARDGDDYTLENKVQFLKGVLNW